MNATVDCVNDSCRVGILSDTHGWLDPRVEAVLRGCNVLVHAGDIGDDKLLSSLSAMTDRLVAVAGNNDLFSRRWSVSGKQPPDLAESATLVLPGGTLEIEHGHRIRDTRHYPECLRYKYPQARAVIFGHTHQQLVDRSRLPWVLNPGAAGRARTHDGPGCLILNIASGNWTLATYRFEVQRRFG